MIFDLHVHTTKGASDSCLTPPQLVAEARRIGLDGVCITEHSWGWDWHDFQRFSQSQDIMVVRGMEVMTDLGHIVAFGLDGYVSGIHRANNLREVVEEWGGFMVAVHPFRGLFSPGNRTWRPGSAEEAAAHPLFKVVDEIEVLNGACTEAENRFALEVARVLGMRGTGGSDAHSTHGLGCYITVFEGAVSSERDLIRELRAKRFYPAQGFLQGELLPYGPLWI